MHEARTGSSIDLNRCTDLDRDQNKPDRYSRGCLDAYLKRGGEETIDRLRRLIDFDQIAAYVVFVRGSRSTASGFASPR
jgi:hypothetical protein